MHGKDSRRRTDVAVPLAQFALAGLLAVVLAAAIGVALQRHAARQDAIKDASTLAKLAGQGIVEPSVTQRLLDGDPRSIHDLDVIVARKVKTKESGIARVKLWDESGRIVYSDNHALIGRRFDLPEEERDDAAHGRSEAELTDLSRDENRPTRCTASCSRSTCRSAPPPASGSSSSSTRAPAVRDGHRAEDVPSCSRRRSSARCSLLQLLQLPLAYRMARYAPATARSARQLLGARAGRLGHRAPADRERPPRRSRPGLAGRRTPWPPPRTASRPGAHRLRGLARRGTADTT